MRWRWTRRAALTLGLGATGAAAYATVVEAGLRLRIARYAPALAGWPQGLRLRLVAIADLHAGEPWMGPERVRGIVAAANALAPDVVVFLGDLNGSHRYLSRAMPPEETAALLAALRAPLGVFAVLGNHDWWDDTDAQRDRRGPPRTGRALAAAGLRVLENDAVRLERDGRACWLLGLGDQWAWRRRAGRFRFAGVDDLPATLAQVTDDAPAILLAHEPDIFPAVPARIGLTLSGHTHGGQVRLFGYSPVVPSRFGNRFAYGHVVEDGRQLIVSGGLGCSIAPVRLGVPPELVVVELGAN